MHDPSLQFSRRELLAAAAGMALAPAFTLMPALAAQQSSPKAFQKAMRWIQLALVEKDPATMDPDWWLEFFKRTRADGACISAGGMCAFYPTRVPFHHRSQWLGERDIFKYL